MSQSNKGEPTPPPGTNPSITAEEFIVELATTSAERYARGHDQIGDYHVPDSRAYARPAGDDRPPRPPQPVAGDRTAGIPAMPPAPALRLPVQDE